MAQRIDNGTQPTAHTAVQAMIVRAQQVADQTGKRVGLTFDLMRDQIELVDLSAETSEEAVLFRTVSPAVGESDPDAEGAEKSGRREGDLDPAAGCNPAD